MSQINDESQQMIADSLNRTSNLTLDAVMSLVVGLKQEVADRATPEQVAADEAYASVIRTIHVFQMTLNQAKS
jgi:hypothetical protein